MEGLTHLLHSYGHSYGHSYDHSYTCLLVIGFTCLLSAYAFHALYLHRLAHIPGPRLAALTSLYQVYYMFPRRSGKYIRKGRRWEETDVHQELHARYGPVVRYGPNLVLVNLPHALPQVYHRRADKTPYYESMARTLSNAGGPGKPDSGLNLTALSAIAHADHIVARRRVAHAYSLSSVRLFEPEVDARIRQWFGELHSRYSLTGELMPVHRDAGFLAYDIVTELAFGERLGFMDAWCDLNGMINGIATSMPMGLLYMRLPQLKRVIDLLCSFMPKLAERHSGIHRLLGNFYTAKKDHLLNAKVARSEKASFLARFMKEPVEGSTPMTPAEIKLECSIAMVGGSQPVSETLAQLVLLVLQHPHVYARLVAELDHAEASGILDGNDRNGAVPAYNVSTDKLLLPYANACIAEGIRLSSPPIIMPRYPPPEGTTLDLDPDRDGRGGRKTIYIPPGAEVASSGRSIDLNEQVYGPDAAQFRPERWLEADEETLKIWGRCNLRWGYGSRVCLGKHFAVMEISKVFLQFFRVFEPEIADDVVPEGYYAYQNYRVRLKARKGAGDVGEVKGGL